MSWLSLASIGAFGAMALVVALLMRVLRVAPGAARRPAGVRLPPLWRWGAPWVGPVGALLDRRLSPARRSRLDGLLQAAALDAGLSSGAFVAGQLLAGLLASSAVMALAAWAGAAADPAAGTDAMLGGLGMPVAAALLGALLPRSWLRDRIRERRRRILRQLPSLLDLLTVSLEAGQSLAGALTLACDRLPSAPLQAELDRVLGEVRAGRAGSEALQAMAARLRIPAVAHLVSALVIGARQGSNLGPLLRAQAAQRRQERFVRAERLALQAPVKLLMPLATCVFPGTFAILFFPVVVRLLQQGPF